MTAESVLDNPVWESLNGPHASLAVVAGQARGYPDDVSRFVGVPTGADHEAWADLARLVGPGGSALVTGAETPPADWVVEMAVVGVQMVAGDSVRGEPDDEAVVLGEDDAGEMADLVARTQPGPWLPRTWLMGTYLGVRQEGRLVAMAGERMHPPGWTEISAVCTVPELRGRGYAGRLIKAVAHGIRERGEVPMLHAAATNTNAIRLYESLGFAVRRPATFTVARVS